MFDWILKTPLELHVKNKEKQAFLLIHANALLLFYYIYHIYIYIYIKYIYIHIYVLFIYHFLYSDSIKSKRSL